MLVHFEAICAYFFLWHPVSCQGEEAGGWGLRCRFTAQQREIGLDFLRRLLP